VFERLIQTGSWPLKREGTGLSANYGRVSITLAWKSTCPGTAKEAIHRTSAAGREGHFKFGRVFDVTGLFQRPDLQTGDKDVTNPPRDPDYAQSPQQVRGGSAPSRSD
jgi:hypothetical protein